MCNCRLRHWWLFRGCWYICDAVQITQWRFYDWLAIYSTDSVMVPNSIMTFSQYFSLINWIFHDNKNWYLHSLLKYRNKTRDIIGTGINGARLAKMSLKSFMDKRFHAKIMLNFVFANVPANGLVMFEVIYTLSAIIIKIGSGVYRGRPFESQKYSYVWLADRLIRRLTCPLLHILWQKTIIVHYRIVFKYEKTFWNKSCIKSAISCNIWLH